MHVIYLALGLLRLDIVFSQVSDPCDKTSYQNFTDPEGILSAGMKGPRNNLTCHRNIVPGWYRIRSPAGEDMPTSCVDLFHCHTRYPVWLKDPIPPADGQVHHLKVVITNRACAQMTEATYQTSDIQVKNCTYFRVYHLTPTPLCSAAYCLGTGRRCSAGETSPTGFTPGCRGPSTGNPPNTATTTYDISTTIPDSSTNLSDSTLGAIIGVFLGVVIIIILIVVFVYVLRKMKRDKYEATTKGDTENNTKHTDVATDKDPTYDEIALSSEVETNDGYLTAPVTDRGSHKYEQLDKNSIEKHPERPYTDLITNHGAQPGDLHSNSEEMTENCPDYENEAVNVSLSRNK